MLVALPLLLFFSFFFFFSSEWEFKLNSVWDLIHSSQAAGLHRETKKKYYKDTTVSLLPLEGFLPFSWFCFLSAEEPQHVLCLPWGKNHSWVRFSFVVKSSKWHTQQFAKAELFPHNQTFAAHQSSAQEPAKCYWRNVRRRLIVWETSMKFSQ